MQDHDFARLHPSYLGIYNAPRKRKSLSLAKENDRDTSNKSNMFFKRTRPNTSSVSSTATKDALEKAGELLTLESGSEEDLPVFKGQDPDYGTASIIKTYYQGKKSSGTNYDGVDTFQASLLLL
jgi:hypothetical protein